MSVQELAPFVATVLRDRVVDDLRAQNASLQRQLEASKRDILSAALSDEITITGPGGTPIYARGNLGGEETARYPWDGGTTAYTMVFANLDPSQCPVRDIENAEIRRGGVLLLKFGQRDEAEDTSMLAGSHHEMMYRFYSNPNFGGAIVTPMVTCGPIPLNKRMRRERSLVSYSNDELAEVKFNCLTIEMI